MNKDLTEMVFILDRSGSMWGVTTDTIGGYNSVLQKTRNEGGEALVSTILFNGGVEVLHDRVPIKDVKEMTEEEYHAIGCTALLDAVGGSIKHIKKLHKELGDDAPGKTIFVITTDGLENASHKYSKDEVKKMVTKAQERRNWEFIFLGANIDAVGEAASLGIKRERSARFINDKQGIDILYDTVADTINEYRTSSKISDEFAKRIEEDYKTRGNQR